MDVVELRKDSEILRLKEQVMKLNRQIIERTSNYLYQFELMKKAKPVYVYNEGSGDVVILRKEIEQLKSKLILKENEIRELQRKNKEIDVRIGQLLQGAAKIAMENEQMKKQLSNDSNSKDQSSQKASEDASIIQGLQEKIKKIEGEMAALQKQLEDKELQVAKFRQEISKKDSKISSQEELIRKQGLQIDLKTAQIVKKSTQIAQNLRKISELDQIFKKHSGQIEQNRNKIAKLEQTITQNQSEIQQKTTTISQQAAEITKLTEATKQPKSAYSLPSGGSIDSQLDTFKKQSQQRQQEYELKINQLTQQIQGSIKTIAQCEKKDQIRAHLEQQLGELQRRLKEREGQYNMVTNELLTDIRKSNRLNEDNINTLINKDDDLLKYEQRIAELEEENRQLKGQMEQKYDNRKIQQLQNEILMLRGNLQYQKSERQSNSLSAQYYVDEIMRLEEEKKDLLKIIQENQHGGPSPNTMLNLRTIDQRSGSFNLSESSPKNEYQDVIEKLNRQDQLLDQIRSVRQVEYPQSEGEQLAQLQTKMQRIKRQLLEVQTVNAAETKKMQEDFKQRLLKKNADLLKMEKDMDRISVEHNKLKQQMDTFKNQRDKAQQELINIKLQLQKGEEERIRLIKESQQAASMVADIKKSYTKEIQMLTESYRKEQDDQQRSRQRIQMLQRQKISLKAELDKLEGSLDIFRRQYDQYNRQYKQVRNELDTVRNVNANLNDILEKKQEELKLASIQLTEVQREKDDQVKQVRELTYRLSEVEKERLSRKNEEEVHLNELELIKKELEKEKNEKQAVMKELELVKNQIQVLKLARDALGRQVQTINNQKQSINNELISALTLKNSTLDELKSANQDRISISNQLSTAVQEKISLNGQISELKQQKAALDRMLIDQKYQIDTLRSQLQKAEHQNDINNSKIIELETENSILSHNLQQKTNHLNSLAHQLHEEQLIVENLNKKLATISQQTDILKEQLQKAPQHQQIEQLQQQISKYIAQNRELKVKLDNSVPADSSPSIKLAKKLSVKDEQVQRLIEENQKLNKIIQDLTVQNKSLETQINERKTNKIVSSLAFTPEKIERIQRSNDKLNQDLVNMERSRSQDKLDIQKLKKQLSDSLKQTELANQEKEIVRYSNQQKINKIYELQLEIEQQNQKFKNITSKFQQKIKQMEVQLYKKQIQNQNVQILQLQITNLKKQKQTLLQEYGQMAETINKLIEANEKDAIQLQQLRNELQQLREIHVREAEKSSSLTVLNEILQIETLKAEHQDELRTQKKKYEDIIQNKDREIQSLKATNIQYSQQLLSYNEKLQSTQVEYETKIKKLEKSHSISSSEDPNQKHLTSELASLKQAYNFVQKRSIRYQNIISEWELEKKQMTKSVQFYRVLKNKLEQENKELIEKIQQYNENHRRMTYQYKVDFKQIIDTLYEQNQSVKKRLQKVENDSENRISELNSTIKELKKIIKDKEEMETQPSDYEFQPRNFQRKVTSLSPDQLLKNRVQTIRRVQTTPGVSIQYNKLYEQLTKLREEFQERQNEFVNMRHNYEKSQKQKNRLMFVNKQCERSLQQLRRTLIICQQQVEFQKMKASRDFSQFFQRMVKVKTDKKEPEEEKKPDQKDKSSEFQQKDCQSELFQKISKIGYQILESLPETSSQLIFKPENQQDLMKMMEDILNFTGSCKQRQENQHKNQIKRQEAYNELIIRLIESNAMEEEKIDDLVAAIEPDEFKTLHHALRNYFRRLSHQPSPMQSTPKITKKTITFDQSANQKNFYSGSEEFFDFRESTQNLQNKKQLTELTRRLSQQQMKVQRLTAQLSTLRKENQALHRAEQKYLKDSKKSVLLQKGRDHHNQ